MRGFEPLTFHRFNKNRRTKGLGNWSVREYPSGDSDNSYRVMDWIKNGSLACSTHKDMSGWSLTCEYSLTVKHQPSKLNLGFRLPLLAYNLFKR